MSTTKTINQIISDLEIKGFINYGDFAHSDKIEYKNINQMYMVCLNGNYNGDVVEIWYNFENGEIVKKIAYSQFYNCESKLKF